MNPAHLKDAFISPLTSRLPAALTPNHISYARLILALPLLLVLIRHWYGTALVLISIAFVLDMIDGTLARQRSLITNTGKILDPIADKAIFVPALCILGARFIPVYLFFFILVLEITVLVAGFIIPSIAFLRHTTYHAIAANPLGQYKMACYAAGVILLLVYVITGTPLWFIMSVALLQAGAMLGLTAAVQLLVTTRRLL